MFDVPSIGWCSDKLLLLQISIAISSFNHLNCRRCEKTEWAQYHTVFQALQILCIGCIHTHSSQSDKSGSWRASWVLQRWYVVKLFELLLQIKSRIQLERYFAVTQHVGIKRDAFHSHASSDVRRKENIDTTFAERGVMQCMLCMFFRSCVHSDTQWGTSTQEWERWRCTATKSSNVTGALGWESNGDFITALNAKVTISVWSARGFSRYARCIFN